VDFWAQHKDFILKVLAGFGVFLVALIARGITYGDDLDQARRANMATAGKVASMQIASISEIEILERDRDALRRNCAAFMAEEGYNSGDPALDATLIRSILKRTRRFQEATEAARDEMTASAVSDIRADINGGFGLLRGAVQDDCAAEAGERNITLPPALGFASVLQIEQSELRRYLLELELVARLVRYGIDARVAAVDEIRITTRERGEVIPGANPEFLIEYPVTIAFRASEGAVVEILNRLERERPRVPIRDLVINRLERPANQLAVELTLLALAADPTVPFTAPEKQEGQVK